MKSFFRTLLAVILGQLVLLGVFLLFIASKLDEKPEVKDGTVLVMTLDGPIPESSAIGGLPLPGSGSVTTHTDILENLEKAGHDDRIQAVVLRIGSPGIGFGKMDELRERIFQLKEAGKPVWAYTEMMGRGSLYLGSACDSLFLLRNGFCSLEGFAAERPFIAGALEKLGVEENLHRIEGYKAAAEIFQREEMSSGSRENLEWMMGDYFSDFVRTVEEERRLPGGFLQDSVFTRAIFIPEEVVSMGLADRLVFWDEVEDRLLALEGVKEAKKENDELRSRPRTVSAEDYSEIKRKDAGIKGKKKIAVVHATGMIQGEVSGTSFPFGATMGASTMAQAFAEAAKDKDVAGIVFRVDSGGGESHTSWKIQRAALEAQKVKPMVVSMCDMAGSGGYLICYPIKPLVANPNSVVGSIGSISGKFNMRGLYNKLGMTKDFVEMGGMADFWSDYQNFTDEQWEIFIDRHWADYYIWVDDIARARGMTREEIDGVGRGRVWTGEQALEHGLIDELGSFDHAVDLLKEKARIPAEEEVEFIHFPKKMGIMEALRSGGFAAMVFTVWDELTEPFRSRAVWAVDPNTYR